MTIQVNIAIVERPCHVKVALKALHNLLLAHDESYKGSRLYMLVRSDIALNVTFQGYSGELVTKATSRLDRLSPHGYKFGWSKSDNTKLGYWTIDNVIS